MRLGPLSPALLVAGDPLTTDLAAETASAPFCANFVRWTRARRAPPDARVRSTTWSVPSEIPCSSPPNPRDIDHDAMDSGHRAIADLMSLGTLRAGRISTYQELITPTT